MSFADTGEVRFGPFSLSVRQRTLSNDGSAIKLSSRAFDVLVALIEARDDVVSKDSLIRRVWSTVRVEENNLHVQIAAVRRALGVYQHYIVTIPGRGYQFVADFSVKQDRPAQLVASAESAGNRHVEPPTNLPAQLTALIGRTQELVSVGDTLDHARMVSLVGPGGVGKTTLALSIAHAKLAGVITGCWVVELGLVSDATLVTSAIAASLRVEELPGKSLIESIIISLNQGSTLLVLDGCEHVLEATRDTASMLLQACPRLRILCTSQAPLSIPGEKVRRIAPFDLPDASRPPTVDEALQYDAVRLFTERAIAADDRFDLTPATLPGVIAICRSLDGMPLAIEIAAARVSLLGLEPVRVRIANRLALLKDDPSVKSDRHRMLWAAIEWSFGLLSEVDRQVLLRVSVFTGGFTLSAAQAVAAYNGLAESDVLRSIGNLVRRSLLTTGPDLVVPRHRMLGAMREFADEALLAASEREFVASRHAEYFRNIADQADAVWETTDAGEWIAPLALELDNFRAALTWALGPHGDPALGARLAAASARMWYEDGHLSEGRRWLTAAIEQAPADLGATSMMQLKRGLADLSIDAAAGVAAAREAVVLAIEQGKSADEGTCQRMLASSLYCLGHYEEAEQTASRAYELLRNTGRSRTFAKCLSDLCVLHGIGGRYGEGLRYNRQARAKLTAIGDDRGVAICLQYAAELEFLNGDIPAALQLAETSLALLRTVNGRLYRGVGLGNMAAYRLAAGDAAGARMAASEALIITQEIDDQLGGIIALEHIALASACLGAAETAARLHGYVEDAHAKMGLHRQGTEQTVHDRLLLALEAALTAEQRADLIAEGQMFEIGEAIALALGSHATSQPAYA